MPEPIQAIMFDIGNVLLRLKTQDFLERLQTVCPILTPERMRAELYQEGPHHAYERGEITGAEFHTYLQKVYQLSWDYPTWLRHWNDYFLPNRPMEVFVTKLQGQVKFWALSNTNLEHCSHVKRDYRLFDSFESVIGSHEQGLRKPDLKLYEAALRIVALPATSILFIDDLEANVKAAQVAGMQAFHYTFNDLELKAFCKGLGLKFPDWDSKPSVMAC